MILRCLLFLAAIAFAATSQAKVITPEDALNRLPQHGTKVPMFKELPATKTSPVLSRTIMASDGEPAVYVFDAENLTRWFLSADDSAPAILGYSDNQSGYSANQKDEEIPEALDYMLECYATEISALRQSPNRAIERPEREPIMPLLKTKWNQGSPFNLLTPNESPSGCVQTAYGQICKYYGCPTSLSGTGSAKDDVSGETLTMDLALYSPFKYDVMEDYYTEASSQEACQAVAELMVTLGFAFNATYKNGTTNAPTANGAQVLFENGYYRGASWRMRNCHKLLQWEDLIYADVAAGHPVVYRGTNSKGTGHAFVIDGYDADGFFHVNWGWGGRSDGYFLVNVLDPKDQGIGSNGSNYDNTQSAAFNLYPSDEEAEVVYNLVCNSDFSFRGEKFTLGDEGYTIPLVSSKRSICNNSMVSHSWYCGLEVSPLESPDVAIDCWCEKSFKSSGPGRSTSSTTIRNVVVPNLDDGQYIIRPIWKNSVIKRDYIQIPIDMAPYQVLNISQGVATITDPEGAMVLPKVDNLKITTGQIILGTRSTSRGTIVNDSDEEFLGLLLGCFVTEDGSIADQVSESQLQQINVPAHSSIECQLFSTFEDLDEAGDYDFVWCVLPYGRYDTTSSYPIISNRIPVTMSLERPVTEAKVTNLRFNQEDVVWNKLTRTFEGVDPEKFSITFNVECTQGFFDYKIYMWPYDMDLYDYVKSSFTTEGNLILAAGENEEVTFEGNYSSSLIPGHSYWISIYGYNSTTKEYFQGFDMNLYFTVKGEYEEAVKDLELVDLKFTTGTYDSATEHFAGVDRKKMELQVTVKCNNTCGYDMYFAPYVVSDNSYAPCWAGVRMDMEAGETKDFVFAGDWSGMSTDTTYGIYIYGFDDDDNLITLLYNYTFDMTDVAGTDTLWIDKTMLREEFFDLQGRRVSYPAHGFYVRKMLFTDGTVKIEKCGK